MLVTLLAQAPPMKAADKVLAAGLQPVEEEPSEVDVTTRALYISSSQVSPVIYHL